MTWYDGNTVWYDDCNGSNGRCGDCDNDSYHLAWPNHGDGGGCNFNSCDCHCGDTPALDCSDWVYVWSACSGNAVWGQIKDCSTMSPHGCYKPPICDCTSSPTYPAWALPRDELTATMFAAIDDLCNGRIPSSTWVP